MPHKSSILNPKSFNQGGYIALMSAIIISLILIGLSFTVSASGYFSRFNVLDSEFKRVSKGLAESCQNIALLKVAQNYNYDPSTDPAFNATLGGVPIMVGSNTCIIKPYYQAPVVDNVNHKKTLYIATQASYQGAFSNIQVSATAQDPAQTVVTPTILAATVIVPPGATVPNVILDGNTLSPITSGQSTTVSPGSHSLSLAGPPTGPNSYTTTGWAGACNSSGATSPALVSGSSNSCYITYTILPTTAKITFLASFSPTGATSNLTIDGSPQVVAWGQPINLSAGSHTLSATTPGGYTAYPWSGSPGCSGTASNGTTGSLTAGNTYTCVITFNEPNLSCADTVMMFDRSGSMTSTDLANENAAAKALLSYYAQAATPAKVGAGSFGGLDGSSALVPVNGELTSSYGTDMSSLSAGPSYPTAATTPNQWTGPANAFANDSSYATNATNGQQQGYNNFAFSIPAGNVIKGVEVVASAKTTGGTPTNTSNLVPNNTGNFNTWSVTGTANKITAVSDASNNTYISQGPDGQSFVMANAGVPSGAVINSVTLYAVASGNNSAIRLMEENGTGAGQQILDTTVHNLSAAWTAYSWAVPTTPSGAAWTYTEVNNWTTRFGVFKSAPGGTAQVSQMYVVVSYSTTANSANLAPATIGNYDAWTVSSGTNNTANRLAAVAASGGTYDTTNTNGNAETVTVAGAGVPSGATINSVTMYASVAESGGNAGVSLRVENGASAGNRSDDAPHTITSTNFATISRAMATNPLTGTAWTYSEVNAWTTHFGIVRTNSSGGTPKVDQIYVVVNYSASATTGNLSPNNTGNFNSSAWTVTGSASKQAALADAVNTSYISEGAVGQTFVVANAGINPGYAVNSVTVYALSDETGGATNLSLMAENGSSQSLDAGHAITNTSFNSPAISWTMAANPLTGTAWTTSEVNNWTTRFGVFKSAPGGTAQVSQMYVVVNYSSPANGNLSVSLSWNNGFSWTAAETTAVTGTEAPYNLGGSTDTWGRTWATTDFSNGNFVVRVQNNSTSGVTMALNYLTVKVDYGNLGTGLYNAINLETGYNNPTNSSVGTNIQSAISVANTELGSSRHTSPQKVLILVSDGEPSKPTSNLTTDSNYALSAASSAKAGGTVIFTVRYSADTDSAAIALMQQLATSPGDAIIPATSPGSPPTAAQMQAFFTQIATSVCPGAAAAVQANLNVTVQVLNTYGGTAGPSAVNLSVTNSASSVAPASQTTSVDGTSITYTYPPFNSGNSVLISPPSLPNYYSPLAVNCPTSATNIPVGQTMFCTLIYYDMPPAPTVVIAPPPPSNIGIGDWQENP